MKVIYLLTLLLIFFINGCAVRGPSLILEPPRIEIDDAHHDRHYDDHYYDDHDRRYKRRHRQRHCPPGQAKKGNC